LREVSHLLKIMALHKFVLLLPVHIHHESMCNTFIVWYMVSVNGITVLFNNFTVKFSDHEKLIYPVVCYCKGFTLTQQIFKFIVQSLFCLYIKKFTEYFNQYWLVCNPWIPQRVK